MATRKGSGPKRQRSAAQLAYTAVTHAFNESFDTYMRAIAKHRPKSRMWLRTFLSEWQKEIEWRTAGYYGASPKAGGRGQGGTAVST